MVEISATERVANCTELVYLIFDQVKDKRNLFSCAIVCKAWNEPALDGLWTCLGAIRPLISLLAPLTGDRVLAFSRPICAADWNTFERYARRIRSLDLGYDFSDFSQDVFVEIAQKMPMLCLLPNLRRLRVHLGMENEGPEYALHSLLFMSDGIRDFTLVLPDLDCIAFEGRALQLFGEFSKHTTKVRNFTLCSPHLEWQISAIELAVVEWVLAMPGLVSFSPSDHLAISSIMNALSKLPSLQRIEFDESSQGYGCDSDFETFEPQIVPGAFPALTTLEFCAKFEHATEFLQMDFAPALTSVFLHSPQLEEAEALGRLLSGLSNSRPSLRRLHLDPASDIDTPLMDGDGEETDRVTFNTLRPLLGLRKLVDLHISYHRRFRLSKSDLGKLLDGWRDLETLSLCSDPVLEEEEGEEEEEEEQGEEEKERMSDPLILDVVASRCPKLRHLSIYLSTRINEAHIASPSAAFESLESIRFGTRPIAREDIKKFALFLSKILPLTCDVVSLRDVDWLRYARDPYEQAQESEDRDKWRKVSQFAKIYMGIRAEGRLVNK